MEPLCHTLDLTTRATCRLRAAPPVGFPRLYGGGLVPVRLCKNMGGSAPLPTPAHVRGIPVSHLRTHYTNLLCPMGVVRDEWTLDDEVRFEATGGFDPFED